LKSIGWSIVARRLKTPFAEVDILARDKAGFLVVVEVKKVRRDFDRSGVVSNRQLARLRRACIFLGIGGLLVAAVGQDNDVALLDQF
jgi:Holliday junction resolvase-like predicted endonuclease